MCNSLITQYFIQAPDYRPFSLTEGCISGCASGISPVLEVFHCVFVDETILSKTLPSNYMRTSTCGSSLCLSKTKNIGLNIFDGETCRTKFGMCNRHVDVFNRPRFMVAVPLEEF